MKKKFFFKNVFFIFIFMLGVMQVNAASITCSSLGDFRKDLQNVFDFAKVLVPLLVIGLTIFDFVKAIASSNDKEIKTSFQRMLKRILYAAIFMFLPLILSVILGLIGDGTVCVS